MSPYYAILNKLRCTTGQKSSADIVITNSLPTGGYDGSADPMYDDYMSSGSPSPAIEITVNHLPAGTNELFLYSNDGNFTVSSGNSNYGTRTCYDPTPGSPLFWQEGVQFVHYTNIVVAAGQPVQVTVNPGQNGKSVIAGLQIACLTNSLDLPQITSQPVNQIINANAGASFSVTATGNSLQYQWFKDGNLLADNVDFSGSQTANLTVSTGQFNKAGSYVVVVANSIGSVTSVTATLTVNSLPACDPVPSGITGWWQAEDTARDYISGSAGMVYSGTSYQPGVVGQAFYFDGVTGCLANTNTAPLTNIQNTFTMEFWAYPQKSFDIAAQNNTGWPGISGQSYAIFPNWAGFTSAAGVGVCVGNNGISVNYTRRDIQVAHLK